MEGFACPDVPEGCTSVWQAPGKVINAPHTGIKVGSKRKLAPGPPGWGTPWKTIYIKNPNNGCQVNSSERLKEGYKNSELRWNRQMRRDAEQGS